MAHNLPVHSISAVELNAEHSGSESSGAGSGPAASLPRELPHRRTLNWIDVLFFLFIGGLAVLPPVREFHKQIILVAIALVQLLEVRLVRLSPRMGPSYAVILKILLSTALLDHTGEIAINSSYWPVYFLPVVTAATYFSTWATLVWTTLASAAYCAYLIPALQEFFLTREDIGELSTRLLFLFLAAMLTNRFAVEIRRRAAAYRTLAEQMAETNRRLAQVQEEARRSERLAALGQMSAGLAHEIRNPLGVIKGSAEMLTRKLQDSNPLAGELAGYISSEVNRLSALVSRFLDFARPQAVELVPGNVAEVVDRALAAVTVQRPGAKVVVERSYTEGLPPVRMDERLAEQVFLNLALNAYEAMEPDGGILRVEISEARREAGEGVEVTLRDSGPGIPPEISAQVFNPFFTTKKTGVGLGLAIVSKIMDEHHGSLRLESEPGRGACFRVFFPAAQISTHTPTTPQHPSS